jgi:hypothetical protein
MANQVSTTQHTVDGTSSKIVISEDSLVAGVPIDTSRVFDFFSLPLELRDRIYVHPVLLEDEQLPERNPRDFKPKIRKLRTSLLLVSRQFHYEYRKISASQQVLYLEDHPWMSGTLATLQWPHKAPLWMMDYCTGDEMELKGLQHFLNTLVVGDLALRSIRIEIYIDFYRQDFERVKGNDEWLALLRIDGFAKVDLLEIYLTRSSWDRRIAKTPRSLVARWKRGDPMHITFIKPSNNFYRRMASDYDYPVDVEPSSTEDSDEQDDSGDSSGGAGEGVGDEGWYNYGGSA